MKMMIMKTMMKEGIKKNKMVMKLMMKEMEEDE